jgi:hypothetical protein
VGGGGCKLSHFTDNISAPNYSFSLKLSASGGGVWEEMLQNVFRLYKYFFPTCQIFPKV